MGNPFKLLDKLRTNIIGGGDGGSTTSIARQSTIEMGDTSPTAKLKKDPLGFSSLAYPKDLVNDITNGHYMLFYINVQNKTTFPYTPASDGIAVNRKTVFTPAKDVYAGPMSQKVLTAGQDYFQGGGQVQYQSKQEEEDAIKRQQVIDNSDVAVIRKSKNKMRTGLAGNYNPTIRITDSVAIYLPPNVQDNYTTTYNATETGLLGYIAASGGKVASALRGKDYSEVAKILLGTAGGAAEEVFKNFGSSLIEMATSAEGGYELYNKVFGRSTNPYMEVLFSGPELRTFNYNFTFAPRNAAEQEEVKKIIHMFRFHQAPELRGDHNMFLGLPAEFDIYYMYQHEDGRTSEENPYYNKISTCVLQSVNVDYTPGGVNSHANGAPVLIKMSLQFLETEMITKQHIEAGY